MFGSTRSVCLASYEPMSVSQFPGPYACLKSLLTYTCLSQSGLPPYSMAIFERVRCSFSWLRYMYRQVC